MKNFVFLFYITFIVVGSTHIYFQTIFLMKSLVVYFSGISLNTDENLDETSKKRILKAINLFVFVCPFFIFKLVIKTNFESLYVNYFLLILTVVAAIFSLCFNFKKIWPKAFNELGHLYYKIGACEVLKKKDTDSFEEELIKSTEVDNNKIINRPEIKPGPNSIGLKYIVTKYFLIQHFYKEYRIETARFRYKKDFLHFIAKNENLANSDSLKKPYKVINEHKNLDSVLKWYEKEIILLLEKNEFKDFPLVKEYFENKA